MIYLFLCFSVLTIIEGLRKASVGTDLETYIYTFQNLEYNKQYIESIFYYLMKIILFFSDDPQSFIFVTSFIINFGIFVFIYRESKIIWLSVFLYLTLFYWFASFNVIRQYIAITFYNQCILFNKK
ncbi:EpsG family protein [Eubacterium limosum]|uniref:EpsG family protein n=1 Tax=Eubacterium limosum TaxID=1736 RepID=UPI00106321EE